MKPGDIIWIDSAPLIASPKATGKLTEVEVLHVGTDGRPYVRPTNSFGPALYINRSWVRGAK